MMLLKQSILSDKRALQNLLLLFLLSDCGSNSFFH